MKTIKNFLGILLLMIAVLLYSNTFAQKASTVTPAANAGETQIAMVKSGHKTETKSETIKTRLATCACGQLTVTVTGPDPDRVVMCNCHLCQKQTGSPFSLQARYPNEEVTIKGKSTAWTFSPKEGESPITGRTCAGTDGITNSAADVVTSHFCPVCGSTVYYYRKSDTARTGIRVGSFADSTFPPPMGSGFEEYKYPWVMDIEAVQMPLGHHN